MNALREERQFLPFVIRSQQGTRKAWPSFQTHKKRQKRQFRIIGIKRGKYLICYAFIIKTTYCKLVENGGN